MQKHILTREELLTVPEWTSIYWEIYATTACNLRCTYCYNATQHHRNTEPQYTVSELLSFLKTYARNGDGLSFIGGEPLIRKDWISDILSATRDMGFRYGIYTNGINLGKLPQDFINQFSHILISIDGDEEQNDRFRGRGTYSKIIENLEKIRPCFHGTIIGRITATPDNDIEKSVKTLMRLSYFDTVYWQYENGRDFQDYPAEKKWEELKRLLDFWTENLKQGRFYHLQPFVSMVIRLLDQEHQQHYHNEDYSLPRFTLGCGAGHHYLQIFITGDIYACPELVGQQNNFMGNIREGIERGIRLNDFANTDKCCECPEFPVCHCRCLHSTPEQYCTLIKQSISVLRKELPLIKSLIDEGKIDRKNFFISDQLEEMF